jgi:uncharacterized protein with PQ loop repeat
MDISIVAGVTALIFDCCVAPSQLLYLVKTRKTEGIFILTYIFLVLAMGLYFVHAYMISDVIFMIATAVSCAIDLVILILLLKWRKRNGKEKNR